MARVRHCSDFLHHIQLSPLCILILITHLHYHLQSLLNSEGRKSIISFSTSADDLALRNKSWEQLPHREGSTRQCPTRNLKTHNDNFKSTYWLALPPLVTKYNFFFFPGFTPRRMRLHEDTCSLFTFVLSNCIHNYYPKKWSFPFSLM